jgi:uncharacterized surface protein with fasciclin (FAS1) repeats
MKTLNCLVLCTTLAAALLATSAPSPQNGVNRDLMDTAMSVHQFDTFLVLVRDADLVFNLKGSGPFTIFAPTNEALENMPPGLLERIHGNKPRLRQFVLHHIVRGSFTAEAAVRAHSLAAMDGTTIKTRNVNGRGFVGNARFSLANVRTSNGMLHGISAVIPSK